MIKNRLQGQEKINRSNYDIRLIENPKTLRYFFEENHLDGYSSSKFAVAAFRNEKLISCATFRKYKQGRYKGELELARFCSDQDENSYGAFGKILKYAKNYAKQQGYKQIVSFSDNRISQGRVYKNNGFRLIEGSDKKLNYYYYLHSRGLRVHRGKCQRLKPPQISKEEFETFPTEALQCSSGLMAQKKFGIKRPLYKIYGWGNKLWVIHL